ncbi:MAG: glycine oxidase ThiO [Streptosporangiales bacterium]|nr:glycine oxidase ThiO [Streptosporangiales bacterium]
MTTDAGYDVAIIGGGVIGLATAWRAAQRGLTVTVIDPEPAGGASYASAGMLAPATEAAYGEERLLQLELASKERYPAFVAELEELTETGAGYRDQGTLEVAFDADDLAVLNDRYRFQQSLGIRLERLTGRECRKLEPMLAPSVRGGLFAPEDHSIDPRLLTRALLVAAERSGVRLLRARAERLLAADDRTVGVRVDGVEIAAPHVVLAAGCWSGEIDGVPSDASPPVRPVKGQILRLRTPVPFLTYTVRGVVQGSAVYVVPRADGEVVVGATQEEMGYDTRVTAGGVYGLLRDASAVLPGITELELTETRVGLRPGSPDNAPVIGATTLPGLYVATGHHRSGVLLTPVTADAMAEIIVTGRPPREVADFSPRRFERFEGARA